MKANISIFMRIFLIAGFIFIGSYGVGFSDADVNKVLEKAEGWGKAAENRELAAILQQAEVLNLLTVARVLRSKEYLTDKDRQKGFKLAGDKERAAGDLQIKVSGVFSYAARDWLYASKEYSKLKKDKGQSNTQAKDSLELYEFASVNSNLALKEALSAYELAVDAYSVNNANNPKYEAVAREKVAACIEKIMAKKK